MNFNQLKNQFFKNLDSMVVQKLSPTAKLKLVGLAQIPLLFAVNPRVRKLDHESCEVYVPLNYITQNHLKSMYFGALAIGADSVIGLLALNIADKYKSEAEMTLVFKDFKADFIKRAETHVIFRCTEGAKIEEQIKRAIASGERVTEHIDGVAYSDTNPDDVFAHFTLGLSLKPRKKS